MAATTHPATALTARALLTGAVIGALLTPIRITGPQHMAMLIPLCLAISVVYKTIRCPDLRDVPMSALLLCITIVLGMYAVGVSVWLIFLILA